MTDFRQAFASVMGDSNMMWPPMDNKSKETIRHRGIIATIVLLTFISSCSKKGETEDLAKAQACLDNVAEGSPSQADACMDYVEQYSDQQANILKCAIKMTSGGLNENKIVKAYNALKDSTQTNKTAAFMAVLSLDYPTVTAGYTKAVAADVFCQASGVPGLMYISGVILAGTYMNKTVFDLSGGVSGINVNDPAAINTAITNMLTQCTSATPPASCTSDLPTLGTTVIGLSGSYCANPSADQNVCGQINNAVTNAGGSSAAVGQALFCYLSNKTYNATTGLCQ